MRRALRPTTLIPTRRWLALLLALALLVPSLALTPLAALAADCEVTSPANSGDGTLRAALARTGNFQNKGCETITFAANVTEIVTTAP